MAAIFDERKFVSFFLEKFDFVCIFLSVALDGGQNLPHTHTHTTSKADNMPEGVFLCQL